ncbi:hypothetical protein EDD29_7606 [Actinocorallia herbida]|uniref:Lipocalin-like protein n=1 Tax=Actinocorallia herbida TaxID=58109 RepID=A0A3N1D8S9_9ACTN|nr:hypothetical protein [Actinocorallia herbida]ROO89896.1 hypothetical protein EDD29_7606 [Actinocorallia herbida]
MFVIGNRKARAAALAAVLGAGVLTGTAAPATAAPAACVLGKWKQTTYSSDTVGVNYRAKTSGAKGVKLTVKRKSLAYDFTGSARENAAITASGTKWKGWTQYKGKLTFTATVKGAKAGTMTAKPKSVKGGATGTSKITSPTAGDPLTWRLAENIRDGGSESVSPAKASFTCAGKKLTLNSTITYGAEKTTVKRVFTRIS